MVVDNNFVIEVGYIECDIIYVEGRNTVQVWRIK